MGQFHDCICRIWPRCVRFLKIIATAVKLVYNLSMEKWKKVILYKDDMPVKVYVNREDTRCFVFPLFGKYHGVHSDKSALDLCTQIMFHVSMGDLSVVFDFAQYVRSQEDTAVIYREVA